jgi:hypothetical protein
VCARLSYSLCCFAGDLSRWMYAVFPNAMTFSGRPSNYGTGSDKCVPANPDTTSANAISWFWGLLTLACLLGNFPLKVHHVAVVSSLVPNSVAEHRSTTLQTKETEIA